MTNEEIFALMDRFEAGRCTAFKLSTKDATLELKKEFGVPVKAPAPTQTPAALSREPEGLFVSASLVGTYYSAAAPDQPPFVRAGDQVKKGQTVCLMEAMKMMSEVPAPCDCVIEEVLKANGELAAFGEPLFRYRPC